MATEGKTYNTKVGTFVEDSERRGVYLAAEIDKSVLVVPKDVSRTGVEIPMDISSSTLFITKENGERAAGQDWKLQAERKNLGTAKDHLDGVAYANNLSLLSSFANASGASYPIQRASTLEQTGLKSALGPVRLALEASKESGPFALVTNNNGGGIINLGAANRDKLLKTLFGVPDLDRLNVPKSYLESFGSFVVGHEVKHLHSSRKPGLDYESWETYIAEVKGDHATLKSYFNSDYTSFVMDMRALGSLNTAHKNDSSVDDHATHIWSEEASTWKMDKEKDWLLPTQNEAEKIMSAPNEINEKLEDFLDDSDLVDAVNENPADRYVYLKMMREQGSFNDIPYGNEYVDKYIGAAERRYFSSDIDSAVSKMTMARACYQAYMEEPDANQSEAEVTKRMEEDPAYRYANLKTLRDKNAFDHIPGANKYIDAELARIEREHPEAPAQYNRAEYEERYSDADLSTGFEKPEETQVKPQPQPVAAPSLAPGI